MTMLTEVQIQTTLNFTQKMIQTPSVNGQHNERAMAEEMIAFANSLELDTEILALEEERPCALVHLGPKEQTGLLLIGHMDTVPVGDESNWEYPPFSGEISGNQMYGRGAIDNKGGIAAAMAALWWLRENALEELKMSVTLIGVPDEESGATGRLGIKYLQEIGKLQGKGAIYVYPDSDRTNIGHRGVWRIKLTTRGQSFHSGSLDWQDTDRSHNAVTGMAEIIGGLERLTFPRPAASSFFEDKETVITPTVITGGSGPSMVPDICEAHVDMRLVPDVPRKEIEDAIQGLVADVIQRRPSLQASVETETYLPPTIIPDDAEVLTALRASVREVLDIDPAVQVSGPANESYLLNGYGIPTCTYGPDGAGAHANNEYVEIDSIFKVAEVYAQTALKLCS
ncbi:MAG: M20 family peptidase [Chloroflexi bacterium]|nr:MAG: M20 family peptidase [Chloroflexota bacterium]MBL1194703.1 M20 family peptidase [Chloroflexota bacterium]NOH11996.1 M20/M25/M40 family metallo-hydrolase [Chloroflexota bacterium]